MTEALGRVASLWRFPVKSMQGEELDAAHVTDHGVLGDRAYALIDTSDGKVASAKNPRKWGRLLQCSAVFAEPPAAGAPPAPVTVTLPDGVEVRSDDPEVDAVLSNALGREVTLAATPPADRRFEETWPDVEGLAPTEFVEATSIGSEPTGERVSDLPLGMAAPQDTFFDLATIHLLTTATLGELERVYPEGRFDVRRYRPNVLIETAAADEGFVENGWVGWTLAIGDAFRAVVRLPTMRCVMTTLEQPGLARDPNLLRAVALHNRVDIEGLGRWACAGSYADVAAPGLVRRGDPVSVLA